MININRWVGYVSISIVMIFGVLMVSGMVGDFDISTRLAIGGLVLLDSIKSREHCVLRGEADDQ